MSATAPVRLLRLPEVRKRLGGFSKVWIWRARRAGRFPSPVRLGPHSIAWIESEIDQFLDERRRERDELAAR
jgi:prophage regulatory protein